MIPRFGFIEAKKGVWEVEDAVIYDDDPRFDEAEAFLKEHQS